MSCLASSLKGCMECPTCLNRRTNVPEAHITVKSWRCCSKCQTKAKMTSRQLEEQHQWNSLLEMRFRFSVPFCSSVWVQRKSYRFQERVCSAETCFAVLETTRRYTHANDKVFDILARHRCLLEDGRPRIVDSESKTLQVGWHPR